MPYTIVCDGEIVDLNEIQYLLSPQDLAAFDLIPKLVEVGVASLKIEGRLKTPEYVASITRNYRRAIDATLSGQPVAFSRDEVQEMEMTFSRGFSHGFLDGNNHKVLVRGDHAKKRGVFLGSVLGVHGNRVRLSLATSIKPGDGVVFDGSASEGVEEQGGRVYEASAVTRGRMSPENSRTLSAGVVDLGFGHRDLDLRKIRQGQRVWKTDDPDLSRRVRATYEGQPHRLVGLDVHVVAITGQPLRIDATTATGLSTSVAGDRPLEQAQSLPASEAMIHEQVARLGGTIYALASIRTTINDQPMVPKSLLNQLRREMVARLDTLASQPPARSIAADPVLPDLRASLRSSARNDDVASSSHRDVQISALCRTLDQARASIDAGVNRVYLDYQDIKLYRDSIETLRPMAALAGTSIYLATPRIQKPGEAPIFRYLSRLGADGLLVRNAGGIEYAAKWQVPFVADFSLNAANELSVEWLMAKGARSVAASYDLSFDQLDDLIQAVPATWLEVVVHQHMPMFHMEHCVFCAFLSPGTDKTNCGRPCDDHDVKLRDRVGMDHPLKADVGCRNTLFNAVPQTAAEYLPRLVARGLQHMRLEFLDDEADSVTRIVGLYRDALEGRRDARTLWRDLKASGVYGVTRGQLAVLT